METNNNLQCLDLEQHRRNACGMNHQQKYLDDWSPLLLLLLLLLVLGLSLLLLLLLLPGWFTC